MLTCIKCRHILHNVLVSRIVYKIIVEVNNTRLKKSYTDGLIQKPAFQLSRITGILERKKEEEDDPNSWVMRMFQLYTDGSLYIFIAGNGTLPLRVCCDASISSWSLRWDESEVWNLGNDVLTCNPGSEGTQSNIVVSVKRGKDGQKDFWQLFMIYCILHYAKTMTKMCRICETIIRKLVIKMTTFHAPFRH